MRVKVIHYLYSCIKFKMLMNLFFSIIDNFSFVLKKVAKQPPYKTFTRQCCVSAMVLHSHSLCAAEILKSIMRGG